MKKMKEYENLPDSIAAYINDRYLLALLISLSLGTMSFFMFYMRGPDIALLIIFILQQGWRPLQPEEDSFLSISYTGNLTIPVEELYGAALEYMRLAKHVETALH